MYRIFLILAAIVSLVYYYLVKKYSYWRQKGVVHPQPELFFGNLGRVARFKTTIGEEFQKIYNDFGGHPFVGIYQFRKPALLVRDPNLAKQLLIKDFSSFHSRGGTYNEKVDPLSAHLVNTDGARWRSLRVKLSPMFTASKIRDIFVQVSKTSEKFREFLKQYADNEETVEFRELAAKFTTEAISSCCFGFETNSIQQEDSEFRRMCKRVLDPSFILTVKRMIRSYLPWIYDMLQMTVNPPDVTAYFTRIVKDIIDYRERNNVERADFMQTLMEMKNANGRKMPRKLQTDKMENNHGNSEENVADNGSSNDLVVDEKLITAQAFMLLLAGFETSSTAISLTMFELACNTDIQNKLYNEIRDVLDKYGSTTYEAISEMEYLDRVVNETLRKHPPGVAASRICTEDYTIPGTDVVIEKGTMIIVPIYALHHDPKYYKDPETFNPDRFIHEIKRNRELGTYLPFGSGPRFCIGKRFANAQTKTGVVSLLKDYEVALSPKTCMPLEYDPMSIVLSTKSGIWLKLRHRRKS